MFYDCYNKEIVIIKKLVLYTINHMYTAWTAHETMPAQGHVKEMLRPFYSIQFKG